jgi:thymidylate synthase (FAD)
MARHTVPEAEKLLDQQFPVLDHGFVILVDYMGSDAAIAQAARESKIDDKPHTAEENRALIRRLMSDIHTSPFEMVEFKFHCAMPIFVARQWIRHRTANVNEQSGRYGEMPELVYVPEVERISWQSPKNKQGSGAQVPTGLALKVQNVLRGDAEAAFSTYHELLGRPDDPRSMYVDQDEMQLLRDNGGISRELARINLPLSTYTQWYWKIDLHNLLHFLFLRLDEHAQWEIRQYAQVMAKMVQAVCPMVWEAFVDYRLQAIRLSLPEREAMGVLIDQFHDGRPGQLGETRLSKREVEEFRNKLAVLGLGFLNGFRHD